MEHPEQVERLVILNAPHPERLLSALGTLRQNLRSFYMYAFQLPWLPERVLGAWDFALIRRILRTMARPGAYTPEDLDRYAAAYAQPGALRHSIDYYRALARRGPAGARRLFRPIHVPTLVLWGEHDTSLGKEMAEPGPEWVTDVRVERLPEAGHFVHHDAPERVRDLIVDFARPMVDPRPTVHA